MTPATPNAALLERLIESGKLMILTGAGVSQESGIPTFRDALTGFWSRFDPAQLATPEAFDTDPALVWGWYEWRRASVLACAPNAAHIAIAELGRRHPDMTLVTQNVDGLHERAGSRGVICLHGSLHSPYCSGCGGAHPSPPGDREPAPTGQPMHPPSCIGCGEPIRPGVVWFGESLPMGAWRAAESTARDCDVLVSIGTSALVYPAASLPIIARDSGATLVQVNPEPTSLDPLAHFNLRGKAAEILPPLVAAYASATLHPAGPRDAAASRPGAIQG